MGHQQKVDANYLFSLMAPEFSPQGSSHRHNEEHIVDYFQDLVLSLLSLLLRLEDDQITGYTEAIASNVEEELDVPDQSPTGEHQESENFSTQDLTPVGVLGWLTIPNNIVYYLS